MKFYNCKFREVPDISSILEDPINHPLRLPLPALLLGLLILHQIHIRLEIHLGQLDHLCLLQNLPHHVHEQHDGQLDVEADKVDAAELGAEAAPALDEDEEAVEDDAEPGADGVRPVLEGQEVRLVLHGEGAAEADRGDADGDPT